MDKEKMQEKGSHQGVSKKTMSTIERNVLASPGLSGYTKKSIVLILRESRLLTKPIDLKSVSSSRTKAIKKFIDSWNDPNGMSINDLLKETGSLMFFSVKSPDDRTTISLSSEKSPIVLYGVHVDTFKP